jgi:hypothetical protein
MQPVKARAMAPVRARLRRAVRVAAVHGVHPFMADCTASGSLTSIRYPLTGSDAITIHGLDNGFFVLSLEISQIMRIKAVN